MQTWSDASRKDVTGVLMGCFTLQKLYGKEPESFPVVNKMFQRVLAEFPAEKVLAALRAWMQRSQEFPTPADIVSLIKRNGRPPLSEVLYIQVSRKEPEHRTSEDWAYIRDFERDRMTGSDFGGDEDRLRTENTRLREQLLELRRENARLADLLQRERTVKGAEPEPPSKEERIRTTVAAMRGWGASEEDIAAFEAGA